MIRPATLLIPLLLSAAHPLAAHPAPQQTQGSTLRAEDLRVADMGYRLAIAGRDLCPLKGPVTGLMLHHLVEYLPADRPAMIAAGLDRGPGVLAVVAGSPADVAGLRAGDVLLSIDGAPFPSPTAMLTMKRDDWRPVAESSEKLLLDRLATGTIFLTVLRGGEMLRIPLEARTGCSLRIRLARSDQKGAYTVRGHVVVTTAALALAANDNELAFIIAHELAHIVLGHTALLSREGVPRTGLTRGMGRNGRIVRETEEAADQLGGRIMLAAGYDPGKGAQVLRRLGTGPRLGLFETHDSDGERIKAMEALGQPANR